MKMEINEFDRSDFNEVLGLLDRFREKVNTVQTKTQGFCTSFTSGLGDIQQKLTDIKFVNFSGLVGTLGKMEQKIGHFDKWVTHAAENLTDKWVVNAEAAVSGLASTSEMAYTTIGTLASLGDLKNMKITTDLEENRKALEGVVGTGETMQRLFDELNANPLLKNLGFEEDIVGRLESKWKVLLGGKEELAGLMTTYGEARKTFQAIREDLAGMSKYNPFKGFGKSVGALFKKRPVEPGEEGKKKGFFSIFRKKDPEDKNWFTAVAGRFKEYSERTKKNLTERVKPLVDYGTRFAHAYQPAWNVASNALTLKGLAGTFKDQSRLMGLNAANGWGIGDRAKNLEKMTGIREKGAKRGVEIQEQVDKVTGLQKKAGDLTKGMENFVGQDYQSSIYAYSSSDRDRLFVKQALPAPDYPGGGTEVWENGRPVNPVNITIGRLVENLNVKPENMTEGMSEIRDIVIDELTKIVYNANKMTI